MNFSIYQKNGLSLIDEISFNEIVYVDEKSNDCKIR